MKKILLLGSHGYIGHALYKRLKTRGHSVFGIDNGSRKANVEKVGGGSITPDNFSEFADYDKLDIVSEYDKIANIIRVFQPDTIINLAHNPSAVYGMMSRDNANETLQNNIIGTSNILWAIKEHSPATHYITIGSMGEYRHDINTEIPEGYFSFNFKKRKSSPILFPRCANSIYHASKVSSTTLLEYLARIWNLKISDAMQGVVFGLYTDECDKDKDFSRFDVDEVFGTVLNRFIAQAVLGEPLTIFGTGEHKRTFLALNDSIQALGLIIDNPPKEGEYRCYNQLSEDYSINDLARMVKYFIDVPDKHKESPRNENTKTHYYNIRTDILKSLGYKPTRIIAKEIEYTINVVKQILEKDLALKEKVRHSLNMDIKFGR